MIVAVNFSPLHVCDSDYSPSIPSEGKGEGEELRPGNEATDCCFCCVPGFSIFHLSVCIGLLPR